MRRWVGAMLCAAALAVTATARLGNAEGRAGNDVVDGHLYVVVPVRHGFDTVPEVRRFALVHGLPRAKPELLYHDLDGPVAVDDGGDLYAMRGTPEQETVLEYAPRALKPTKTIDLLRPNPPSGSEGPPAYTSMAVDHAGYLYVAATSGGGSYTPANRCGWEVTVYGPEARRLAIPAQCLVQADPDGMGIDRAGNLYLGATFIATNAVFAIAAAATAPNIARTLRGPSLRWVVSTAVDDDGLLYVLMLTGRKDDPSYVGVYRASGDGDVPALRTMHSGPAGWNGTMAVWGSHLYLTSGSDVLIFDKNATGTPTPLATLSFQYGPIAYVAVGP